MSFSAIVTLLLHSTCCRLFIVIYPEMLKVFNPIKQLTVFLFRYFLCSMCVVIWSIKSTYLLILHLPLLCVVVSLHIIICIS